MIQKLSNHGIPCSQSGFLIQNSNPPQQDLPSRELSLRQIRDLDELRQLIPAWKRLAETSLEANSFYEPHALVPAMQSLADDNVSIVAIEGQVRVCPDHRKVLCGLFPIRKSRSLRGVPFSTIEMWAHDYCFLTTPLIRYDVASQVVDRFLDWQQKEGALLFHLPKASSGGPVDRLLQDSLLRRNIVKQVRDSHYRAIIQRRQDTSSVLQFGLSRKRRHEINRNRRKLSELGELSFQLWTPDEFVDAWLDEFLELERNGWKGRGNTAIAQNKDHLAFFRQLILTATAEGRASLIRMQLDGKTIATKINLVSNDNAFCFKIAYDERYSMYSPGVLLEVENLNHLHELDSCLSWMDSCAQPGHLMIDNIWPDRRKIESIVIPSSRRLAPIAAAMLPMVRAAKSTLTNLFRKKRLTKGDVR